MARHYRRLILWFVSCVGVLVLLALLALGVLWWRFDPDDYRTQIEARASAAIGRPLHLTGALRWQVGRRIAIVSEGGDVANAAGFEGDSLARWSRIRFGLAARPLLHRRVEIDRIDIDGLQLNLQRDAAGAVNWKLQPPAREEQSGQPVVLRIGAVAAHDANVHYKDLRTGAEWQVANLEASTKLPEDLLAAELEFGEASLQGRLSGPELAGEGVTFGLQAPTMKWSAQRVQLPGFTAHWAEATLAGSSVVQMEPVDVSAKLTMQAPSLRALLATGGIVVPAMRDKTTLGKMNLGVTMHYAGAATFDELSLQLDDTTVQGKVSLPRLAPLAVRFNLTADHVDLDRYREPTEVRGKPLELPLAWLKQLDAQGTLRIRQATIAGAAAKEVRIDVE